MRISVNKIILGLVSFAVIALFVYLSFDRIVLYIISKTHGIYISCGALNKTPSGEYLFTNLKTVSRKSGIGIAAKRAKVRPIWRPGSPKDIEASFDLYGVGLIMGAAPMALVEGYESLPALVSTPFRSNWVYDEVSGKIVVSAKGIEIKELRAAASDIRFSLSGRLYRDNTMDADITIYFSGTLAGNIPDELADVVLNREKDGWKSLSVHLKGDLKSPAIEISSRLFRLNIKSASGGKL